MAFRNRRWLSMIVAVMIIIAMLPAHLVHSATAQYFTFPSYGATPAAAFNNPEHSQVISKFPGTFSQAVPATLNYSIQQVVQDNGTWVDKGTPNTVSNTTPLISGAGSNEFNLLNVNLFLGMNKITMSTSTGVEGVCYVFYDDAPFISSITMNGTALNSTSPTYISTASQSFLIKAANASTLIVNGKNATNYGPGLFTLSNMQLNPGMNNLTFVAESDTRSFSITRQIVYTNGAASMYNLFLQSSDLATDGIQIDTGDVVTSLSSLPKGLKGEISFPVDTVEPNPTFTSIDIPGVFTTSWNPTGKVTLTGPVIRSGYKVYSFFIDITDPSGPTAGANWPIVDNGNYSIDVTGTYDVQGTTGKTFTSSVSFTYKNSSKVSIANIQSVYGVNPTDESGGTPGPFQSNIPISNLPLYLLISAQNNTGAITPELKVTQNGLTKTLVVNDSYKVIASVDAAGSGSSKIKIINLPFKGPMTLEVTVDDGGIKDTFQKPITIDYNPIPSIVVNGIYNGDNYQTRQLPDFSGRLFNFNTLDTAEMGTIAVTVNGVPVKVEVDANTSSFQVFNTDPATTPTYADQLKTILGEGPNQVVVKGKVKVAGTTQVIPVETRLTVYYYSPDAPGISPAPKPVPVAGVAGRYFDDASMKFKVDPVSNTTFTTTERKADILFDVTKTTTDLIVMRDGKQLFTVKTSNGDFDGTDPKSVLPALYAMEDSPTPTDSSVPKLFRLFNLDLNVGSNSFVIKAVTGSKTTFVPLTIVRSTMPNLVLSPMLPQERVINQNFVKVEISGDGADSILLGKTPMDKLLENGDTYFVGTVENLKKGKNTIKYTIQSGKQKTNQSFDVTYANTNTIGAEYSTSIGGSGKINAFNNAFSVTFPKGTMLTPYNDTTKKIELFDSQKILAGIADPADGRTVKTFNHLGTINEISGSAGLIRALPEHFGYASPLYWFDAGYFDAGPPSYVTIDGMHPYYGDEMSYADPGKTYNLAMRTSEDKWMKTTQRGTLTIQYDPSIRDFAANRVSIYRLGLKGSFLDWENLGGKVNTKNHTVSTTVDSFGYYAVFYNTFGFDDTQTHDFARDDMELLFSRGIMNSKTKDGTEFGAYEPTTRGEFATILVKALNLPLTYDERYVLFFDVPHDLNSSPYWDYRYIETAGQKGIARGMSTRQFAPDEPVTREQAAIMIAYALNLKLSIDFDKSKLNLDKIFSDSGKIGVYSRAAVEAVYKAKLMAGRSVTNPDPKGKPLLVFDPQANITRAETAKVIANLMRIKKLL